MEEAATGHVLFGLDPLWVSTALLIVTYATIMTEKLNASGKFIVLGAALAAFCPGARLDVVGRKSRVGGR